MSAYLALDFTGAGLMMMITSMAATGIMGKDFVEDTFSGSGLPANSLGIYWLVGTVCFTLGILLYVRAFQKCPSELKAKCIPCMIMSAMGVTMKLVVFFLPIIWKLAAPPAEPPEYIYTENNVRLHRTGTSYSYLTYADKYGSEVIVSRDDIDILKRRALSDVGYLHWD